MLSFEFENFLDETILELNNRTNFIRSLGMVSKGFRDAMNELSTTGTSVVPIQKFRELTKYKKVFENSIKPREFFEQIANVQDIFEGIAFESFSDDLSDQLGQLSKAYETYLVDHTDYAFFDFSSKAESVYYSLKTVQQMFLSIKGLLTIPDERPNKIDAKDLLPISETSEFSLILESRIEFTEFAEKIRALDVIYREISRILQVRGFYSEPMLIKIESGSLWSKFKGEKKTNKVIESVIVKAAKYLYENYTNDGKLEKLPRRVQAVQEVLGLRNALDEAGVPTEDIDSTLASSGALIADELNRLLIGEPSIQINGLRLSVGEELKQKYLTQSRERLLGEKAESLQVARPIEHIQTDEDGPNTEE